MPYALVVAAFGLVGEHIEARGLPAPTRLGHDFLYYYDGKVESIRVAENNPQRSGTVTDDGLFSDLHYTMAGQTYSFFWFYPMAITDDGVLYTDHYDAELTFEPQNVVLTEPSTTDLDLVAEPVTGRWSVAGRRFRDDGVTESIYNESGSFQVNLNRVRGSSDLRPLFGFGFDPAGGPSGIGFDANVTAEYRSIDALQAVIFSLQLPDQHTALLDYRSLGLTAYLRGAEADSCDILRDWRCNHLDLDELAANIISGGYVETGDVDGDGILSARDYELYRDEVAQLVVGDSNLSGHFNSSDLVQVLASGQYEDHRAINSEWQTGDWNGDLEFDTADLVTAFQANTYEATAVAVPEPRMAARLIVLIAALIIRHHAAVNGTSSVLRTIVQS